MASRVAAAAVAACLPGFDLSNGKCVKHIAERATHAEAKKRVPLQVRPEAHAVLVANTKRRR
jgi:hypothetical protein